MRTKTYFSGAFLVFISVLMLFYSWDGSVTLTGLLSVVDVAPKGFEYEEPANISREAAFQDLLQMTDAVRRMEGKNYSVNYVKDALQEADLSYRQANFTHVFKIHQLVLFIEAKKDEFVDKSTLFSQKEQELLQQEIYSNESTQLFQQAGEAFRNEQLDEAFAFLEQAELELQKAKIEHTRLSGLIKLSKSFLRRNWWKISIILLAIGMISWPLSKIIRKNTLQRRLTNLQKEYAKTTELTKQLQKECFVDKKISVATYKIKAAKYEERLSEIKHTMPVIEEQLKGKKKGKMEDKESKRKGPKGVLEIK